MKQVRISVIIGLGVLLAFAVAVGELCAAEICRDCHDEDQYGPVFAQSVHGPNGCRSCHFLAADLQDHGSGNFSPARVVCERCHRDVAQQYAVSIHRRQSVACYDCHTSIHSESPWRGEKQVAVATCLQCHPGEDYSRSVHGEAVAAGNPDSAACHDCHGLHDIGPVSSLGPGPTQAFRVVACLNCHDDNAMMRRNQVRIGVAGTFLESQHGKSYRLGSTRRAAGCADCHRGHLILPVSDPASSLYGDNLVQTCSRCHQGASASFVQYFAHGDHHDRDNYPQLYWAYIAMTGLLVAVFAFFWLHSLLWMFRGFVENREKLAAQARGEGVLIPSGHKLYRRFPWHSTFFHILVIVSFLGLSLTGLPLKFSEQPWAQAMMSFYGGVEYAGLLHRACAILTFYYFIAALLFTVNFLFVDQRPAGTWWQRLFGPDSLMPNGKDFRDLKGMLLWFLFLGPKPEFERWTYWEKFDFLAVFWGMAVIGSSGLLLWFPEFFGQFLPGWLFNVAIIVHSDEALLATGFIFTVHFFNTHARPEKFPMDFVIFNGLVTKQELLEERKAQWQRYQDLGITERFEVKKSSSVLYDFIMKGFGFFALFTGLALAVLMLLAFIGG